jgi:hypothetical protein
MRYLIVGLALFGVYCALARFTPGLLMGASLPVLLIVAVVCTFTVAHRVK